MSYVPHPLDTGSVCLSGALESLTERLAENAHDVWAAQRIAQGWTYGPRRDDDARRHPCLVPYADLPESEKKYDRAAAVQTLKAILAMGYAITPPTREKSPCV